MSKKTYDEIGEHGVVIRLNRKRSVRADFGTKTITVQRDADDCGNSTWGKIDYLVHYCGYVQVFNDKAAKQSNAPKRDDERKERKPKKAQRGIKISKKLKPLDYA